MVAGTNHPAFLYTHTPAHSRQAYMDTSVKPSVCYYGPLDFLLNFVCYLVFLQGLCCGE